MTRWWPLLVMLPSCLAPLQVDQYRYVCEQDLDCANTGVCVEGKCVRPDDAGAGGGTGGGAVGGGTGGGTGGGATGGGGGAADPFCGTEPVGAPLAHRAQAYAISDLVGLCESRVLLGDTTNSKVRLVNIATGVTERDFPLPGPPVDLELDLAARVLFVTVSGASALTRIDLVTGVATTLPTDGSASVLLTSAIFGDEVVAVGHGPSSFDGRLFEFRPDGGLVAHPISSHPTQYVVADAANARLFIGEGGTTADTLGRYSLVADTLTNEQEVDICSNSRDLSLAPDGGRIAFTCGGGNAGYVIHGRVADDLTQFDQVFQVGAYPTSGAYSATRFAATNGDDLQLYSLAPVASVRVRDSGQLLGTNSGCTGGVQRLRFSPGGRAVYGWASCTSASSILFMDDGT